MSAAIFGLTRLESTVDPELSEINTEIASISPSISSDPAISLGGTAEAMVTTSPLCKIAVNSSGGVNVSGAYSLTETACTEDQLIASLFNDENKVVENQKTFSTSFATSACEDNHSDKNYVQIDISSVYVQTAFFTYSYNAPEGYFSQYNQDTKQYSGTIDDSELEFQMLEYLNANDCDSWYAISFKFIYRPPSGSGFMNIPSSYAYTCIGDDAISEYVLALVENNLGDKLCIAW